MARAKRVARSGRASAPADTAPAEKKTVIVKGPMIKATTIGSKMGGPTFLGRSKQKHKWRNRLGVTDLVEPPIDPAELADLLIDSTDYSSVCRQIATDVAGLGWQLIETEEGKTAPRRQIKNDREIADKFFRESPGGESHESLRSLLQKVCMDWESVGDGYIEIAADPDDPEERPNGLFHLQAVRTRIRDDKRGFGQIGRQPRDIVWFRNYGEDPTTGIGGTSADPEPVWPTARGEDDLERLHQVIHLRHYHPASFWYGIAPIVPAIAAVRGNTFAADRNIKFFFNKALPEIALIVEGSTETLPKEEMQAFVDNLTDHFMIEMQGEHFKPLFVQLPNGIKFRVEKMSPEMKDSDHRGYRNDNTDEILRAYAMMPNRVGRLETANLGSGTGESQIEIYKSSVINPRQEELEGELTRIMRDGLKIKTLSFKFNEIDTVDEQREATIAGILGSLGWLTINEGRAYTSQFLKIDLQKIEEPWADLPYPILAPQLALMDIGINGIMPVTSEDNADDPHAQALSRLAAAGGIKGGLSRYFVDQAYQRFFHRDGGPGGDALSDPADKAGPRKSTRTKKNHQPR